jgi:isopenicillin-N epimerase
MVENQTDISPLKHQFLLDPSVVYLNHGSFGATPKQVFQAYQDWQLALERQPVEFLDRQAAGFLSEARAALAQFLGCPCNDLVFFPNPTTAVNMAARSLELQPGDEVLSTDHEYGAMDRTWRYICRRRGARFVTASLPLPLSDPGQVLDSLRAAINHRTKAIFISHITSPTALRLPVEEVCRLARTHGLLSIVDGAHAPGQIALDLSSLGADLYTGACHKWLCAPKGAAFLYAAPEVQPWLEPLIVSWGYEAEQPGNSQYIDYHEWQGTRDLAAYLSVPAAIDFQRRQNWSAVRERCHQLARQTRTQIDAMTGCAPICPDGPDWFAQMFAVRLPDETREDLQAHLLSAHRIEVPVYRWNGQILMRVSFQAYNGERDAQALLASLEASLSHAAA